MEARRNGGTDRACAEHSDFECPKEGIRRLWRGLQESCGGGGQAYLVSGGPGSGKTRFLGELAAEARVARIRVVASSARDENARGEALGVKIIRDLDDGPSRFLDAVDGKIPAESIHERSSVRMAPKSLPSSFGNKGDFTDSSNLVDSICAALERAAAASTPILLIVDDLDEADDASAEAIGAVARQARPMSLIIVATCRSVDTAEQTTRPSLAEFARLAIHIRFVGANQLDEMEPSDLPPQHGFEPLQGSDKSNRALVPAPVPAATPLRDLAISSSTRADEGEHLEKLSLSTQVASAQSPVGDTVATHEADGGNYANQQVPAAVADSADSSDSAAAHERCELLIALGEAQSRKGEKEAAENSLREAAALAERLQDPARLTRIVLALPAWHWPGPGEANPLALLLAQRGLVIDREDSGRRAILMARLAAELSYDPGYQRYSADLAAAAWEQVLAKTDPRSELYVRLYRDQVLRQPNQLSERLVNAEEILRLAIEAGDYGACCVAALGKSTVLTTMGDMAAAEHAAEFAVGILPTSQVRFHHGLSAAYRASRAVTDGRFSDAAQEFARCRALADACNLPYLVDVCWPTMLMSFGEEERFSELEAVAEDTVRRRPSVLVYSALLSWLKVQMGCFVDASFLLERLAADEFANLSSSAEGLVGMAALAGVCASLNRPDCAAILHDRLLPCAELNATLNAFAVFGSAERYVGILASVLGRLDEAIEHFEKSFRFDRRSGARLWAIYSGCELASSLVRRGTAEDRARALGLLSQLEAEAAGSKMKRALSRLSETRELLSDTKVTTTKSRESTAMLIAEPVIPNAKDGSKRIGESAAPPTSAGAAGVLSDSGQRDPVNGDRVAMFCWRGEYWQVGYQERTSSLRHRRGLELISLLLRHPGQEFFAIELTHEGEVHPRTRGHEDRQEADSAGAPVLDAEAKRSYRERLKEIRDEVEKLRKANDVGRAAKLEEEQDFLTRELARAIGLFGRDRKFGSESERARKRVSIAITRAIRLISLDDEHFGHYLERSIRTGNLCCYTPDPGNPVKWL
jgi:tetratricopeptide (TPR) repeat protein